MDNSLAVNLNQHFKLSAINEQNEKIQCHKVRYNVYCEQQNFEPLNKEQQERDGLDAQAHHNLISYLKSNTAIATSRMLFKDMPIYSLVDKRHLPQVNLCGEVSRFCINHEKMHAIIKHERKNNLKLAMTLKRMSAFLSPAMMKLNIEACLNKDRPYLLGITEPHLIKRMNKFGFAMENIGAPIEYHGLRQPFLFRIEKSFDRIKQVNNELWAFMTNNGELHKQAHTLVKKLNLY